MKSPKDKHKMNYNKITKRTEQKTKRKIQTDKKLNGLPNAGNSEPKVTNRYDTKFTYEARIKKHAECDKIH